MDEWSETRKPKQGAGGKEAVNNHYFTVVFSQFIPTTPTLHLHHKSCQITSPAATRSHTSCVHTYQQAAQTIISPLASSQATPLSYLIIFAIEKE